MNYLRQLFLISILLMQANANAQSVNSNISLQQVLQKVVDHYPSIKSAALQVEKARQENIKAESQLTWGLKSNVGYSRGTSLFGTATDRYNLDGSLNRNLENGGALGFNASLSREDASDTFGPTIPNPLTKTRVDVNYRHRFEKGSGNPEYAESLESASAGNVFALSDKLSLYDQLASQVIELYLATATTQARIKSIDKSIERAQRLKKYIEDEFKLGLSEEKDVLQVNARLKTNKADKQSLQVAMQKQVISLNRLMGRSWEEQLLADISVDRKQTKVYSELYKQSQSHSPELKRLDARLKLSESAIRSSRDKRKDDLDLVLFLGNEFNQGDTSSADLDESEVIGGISLEFNRGLDKSGFDAQLRQAHYDRGIALEDKKLVLENLQYDISSLLAEIQSSEKALIAFKKSVQAEDEKLKEALSRYKDGRIETDRIIDFESQLAVAELSLDLQTIELVRRYHQLNLIRGGIWKNILLPQFTFEEYTLSHPKESHK